VTAAPPTQARCAPPRSRTQVPELLRAHVAAVGAERLGVGPDPYLARPTTHPMALALYLEGLVELHAQGDQGVPSTVGDRLLSSAASDSRAWGLGFGWHGRDAGEPYAITTAVCGRALLALYRATGSERHRLAATAAADWLCDAVEWPELPGTGRRGPAYSPNLPYAVPNVTSMAAGFLWQAATMLDPRYADNAREATLAVVAAQAHGAWAYGEAGSRQEGRLPAAIVVDLIHSSYTLLGLADCVAQAPALGGDHAASAGAARIALADGLGFVARHLSTTSGWCREKVAIADERTKHGAELANRPRLRRREIATGVWVVAFPAESRLWGYGAWLSAMARATAIGAADAETLLPTLSYVWAKLATSPSARFPLTSDDRRAFPRHEAHLFAGLAAAGPVLAEAAA